MKTTTAFNREELPKIQGEALELNLPSRLRGSKTVWSWWKILGLALWVTGFSWGRSWAGNEAVTVPLILGDYYAWSYTEIFEDHADIFGWSTAGVDALGWGILALSDEYSGLFFVNLAGIAKTVYPAAALLGTSDSGTRERAWIALGTHAATLLTLELLGKPAISVQSTLGPRQDGTGLVLTCHF